MTPEQLAEIKARRAAASNEITALTQRIRQWTTSIPVQNTDSDWIFILALESIDALIAEVERLAEQRDELQALNVHLQDQLINADRLFSSLKGISQRLNNTD